MMDLSALSMKELLDIQIEAIGEVERRWLRICQSHEETGRLLKPPALALQQTSAIDLPRAENYRELEDEERDRVHVAWDALPEYQRTRQSRANLALQFRCSLKQIGAMTRFHAKSTSSAATRSSS